MAPMRLALCLLVLLWSHAALAMRFAYYPAGAAGGAGLLAASGEVKLGDEERLRTALRTLPAGTRIAGLSLDSPGGDLEEGLRLAAAIHDARLATVVGEGAKCASACFIAFAAGAHLFASTTALVGVHSASYAGLDTVDAQAATVKMARRLADYGVPDAILGKLVTAHPSQIWWLNRSDLEAMHVDPNVPQAGSTPVSLSLPSAPDAPPAALAARRGFKVEPAARGYQLVSPAHGFSLWRPGSNPCAQGIASTPPPRPGARCGRCGRTPAAPDPASGSPHAR